jgi:hypothetical protein
MQQTILTLLGGAGFGSIIVGFFARGKTKAETAKLIAESYGEALENLRDQIKFQGELITSQASQITTMQQRELELLKLIGQHHEEKKALIEKHTLIEAELRGQIKALENKLANRLTKIENKFQ